MYVMALAPAWMVRRIAPLWAAGGDDGNLREAPADLRHDLRRGGGAGDIEKVGSRLQAAADVRVSGDHRDDHGNVHHLFDLADDIVGGGGIQHHAVGTLVLGLDGQPDGAGAGGDSAAHAHEYRHVGHADDGWEITGWGVKG